MKKILLAGTALLALTAAPAFAADAPIYRKGPAPVAYAPFSWNGCYLGLHVGGGWGTSDLGPVVGVTANATTSGWFGGGQIGCNWHTSPSLVLGIEGDLAWANITGSAPIGGTGFTYVSRLNYFGTVRGRIGFAMDRALLYGTAGFAWGNHTGTANPGGFSDTQTHLGWAGGVGLEYAFAPNWSTKLEYLYLDLGSKTYTAGGFTGPINVKAHTLKLGVNYRF